MYERKHFRSFVLPGIEISCLFGDAVFVVSTSQLDHINIRGNADKREESKKGIANCKRGEEREGSYLLVIIVTNSEKNKSSHWSVGSFANSGFLTFVVDLTISIDVGLSDHLVHFLIRQLLAQVGHDVPQLRGRDEAVAVLRKGMIRDWQARNTGDRDTLSKTLKASRISSSLSVSFIFLAIMVRNSGKSMVPLPGVK